MTNGGSGSGTPGTPVPWTETPRGAIIIILISVIFSAITSFFVSNAIYQNQIEATLKMDRQNLAKGFLNDVEYVNKSINGFLANENDPTNPDYGKATVYIDTFYPDWGLYYSNGPDIIKFQPELSNELYDFYFKILTAEDARKQFNNFDVSYPIDPDQPLDKQKQNRNQHKIDLFKRYKAIVADLHQYTIPNLVNDLKKVNNPT